MSVWGVGEQLSARIVGEQLRARIRVARYRGGCCGLGVGGWGRWLVALGQDVGGERDKGRIL